MTFPTAGTRAEPDEDVVGADRHHDVHLGFGRIVALSLCTTVHLLHNTLIF